MKYRSEKNAAAILTKMAKAAEKVSKSGNEKEEEKERGVLLYKVPGSPKVINNKFVM